MRTHRIAEGAHAKPFLADLLVASGGRVLWKLSLRIVFVFLFVCGVLCHFQHYFSYIVMISFIGGGNWSTRRKPPICRRSLQMLYRLSGIQTHNVSGDRYW